MKKSTRRFPADIEQRIHDAQRQIADQSNRDVADLELQFVESERALRVAIELKQTNNRIVATEVDIAFALLGHQIPRPLSKPPATTHRLRSLVRVADMLPIPTRKAIKEMAGDYMDEVQRLHAEGRPRMARWNVVLAWGDAFRYVLRSPFDWIVSLLLKNLRGSSQ